MASYPTAPTPLAGVAYKSSRQAAHQRRISVDMRAASMRAAAKAEMLAHYAAVPGQDGNYKLLPLCTPTGSYGFRGLPALSAFGGGVVSFFKTVKCLALVFFVISVLSLPSLVFNVWGSGEDYSLSTISLSATTAGHLATIGNFTTVAIPFSGGKAIAKADAALIYAVLDIIGVAVLLLAFCFMKYWQIVDDVELQANNITLEAYSVYVRNVPHDIRVSELVQHFQGLSSGGKVANVHIVKDNMHLYGMFVTRGKLFRKLERLEDNIRDMEAFIESGEAEPDGCCGGPRSQLVRMQRRRQALVDQANAVSDEARDLTSDDAVAAFVTFDRQDVRATVLEDYSTSWIRYAFQPRRLRLHRQHVSHRLLVLPAPAPSAVSWANLNVTSCNRYTRQAITTIIALMVIFASFILLFFTSAMQARLAAQDLSLQCTSSSIAAGLTAGSINATSVANLPTSDPQLFCYCETVDFSSMQLAALRAHPLVSQCAAQTCPRFFRIAADVITSLPFCVEWLRQQTITTVLIVSASIGVIVVNLVLAVVMQKLTAFEAHHSLDEMEASLTTRLFIAQFINTALLIVLINAPINQYVSVALYTAKYTDMTPDWYSNVGTNLMTTMLIQIGTPHLYPVALALYQRWRQNRSTVRSLTDMKALYRPWPAQYSFRYAQLLATVFVCYTFSTGMPLMNLIAFASLFVAFFCDKFFFLRLWSRPPQFRSVITRTFHSALPLAMMLHLAVGAWSLSQSGVFDTSFDPLRVRSTATTTIGTGVRSSQEASYGFSRVLRGAAIIAFIGFLVLALIALSQLIVKTLGWFARTLLNTLTCGQFARYINSDGITPVALQIEMPTLTQALDKSYVSRRPEHALKGEGAYSMLLNKDVQSAFAIVPEFAEMATSIGNVARYSMQVKDVNGRKTLIATWTATQRQLLASFSGRHAAAAARAATPPHAPRTPAAGAGVGVGAGAGAGTGVADPRSAPFARAAAPHVAWSSQMNQYVAAPARAVPPDVRDNMRAVLKRSASLMLLSEAGSSDVAAQGVAATASTGSASGSVGEIDPHNVTVQVPSPASAMRGAPVMVASDGTAALPQLAGAAPGSVVVLRLDGHNVTVVSPQSSRPPQGAQAAGASPQQAQLPMQLEDA